MGITLRTVTGSTLTYEQVDTNFSSLIYSGSVSGNNLTLHFTSSAFAPNDLILPIVSASYASTASYASSITGLSDILEYNLTDRTIWNNGKGNAFYNTSFGDSALKNNTTGNTNTAIGYSTLVNNTEGTNNTATGNQSLFSNTTGYGNTSVGSNVLYSNTTGAYNIGIGVSTLYFNTTGQNNVGIGDSSLRLNTAGFFNIALGSTSLYRNTTGYGNTAIGPASLYNNTAQSYNTAVGYRSAFNNSTGKENVVLGAFSLYGAPGPFIDDSGNYNVSVGTYTLYNNAGSNENTGLGYKSLYDNSTGNWNVGVGSLAGSGSISGSHNVFVGFNTTTVYSGANNQVVIGSEATSKGANTVTLGNSSITGLYCNVQTITALSDQRDKSEVKELNLGLDFIKDLKPVSFTWTRRDGSFEGVKDVGFIAQELDQTQQKFNSEEYTRLVDKKDPEKYYADYMRTYPMLIKAVQELSQQVETLQNELNIIKNS